MIALMTDYGYKDPYVGVVKAVIKSINPEAEIIDITHGIERHNIVEAAIALAVSAKYFPRDTIFVVVVDPGVGGPRRSIVIETNNYILIGPDNGSLSLLALRDGIKRVIDISGSKYTLQRISHTFHGRDIFAPVAGWISRGIPLEEIGVEVDPGSIVRIDFEEPYIDPHSRSARLRVLYVDVYGNIMTNMEEDRHLYHLSPRIGSKIEIKTATGIYQCTYETTFSKVPVGELVCYVNSWGFLEIAVNQGDAARLMRLKHGDSLEIRIID